MRIYVYKFIIYTNIYTKTANCRRRNNKTNQPTKGAKLFRDLNDKYFAFDDKPTSKQSFLKKLIKKILY